MALHTTLLAVRVSTEIVAFAFIREVAVFPEWALACNPSPVASDFFGNGVRAYPGAFGYFLESRFFVEAALDGSAD